MGKTQSDSKRTPGGKQHADVRGSVADNIATSEAGRARKRAERKSREAVRATHQAEGNAYESALETRARIEQTIDHIDIAMDCENIFKGVEGDYRLFGLTMKVRLHETVTDAYKVLEVVYALPETGIKKLVRFGTYIPLTTLRMNPQRVDWRNSAHQALSEYLHAQAFGAIAKTFRRQHFAEAQAMQERAAANMRVTTPHVQHAATELYAPLDHTFLHATGLWVMPDGVVVKTWCNPRGAHCASVRSVPNAAHPLADCSLYIKTTHLHLQENGMSGSELRDYLRTHLPMLAKAA